MKGRKKKKSAVEQRKLIQSLKWDKGLTETQISLITGCSRMYIRNVAGCEDCECGQPVKRGAMTCERCEHLESVRNALASDRCGVKEADAPYSFFYRLDINKACEEFEKDRGIERQKNNFNQWEEWSE